MCVKPWRGNPTAELKPIEERVYRKKIYVGQLNVETSMEQVEANMRDIYQEEIADGTVATVKAYLNQASWERQEKIQAGNIHHTFKKSACVVLTSHPGKPLEDVGLKIHLFKLGMRRAIRTWSGPIPWSADQDSARDLIW